MQEQATDVHDCHLRVRRFRESLGLAPTIEEAATLSRAARAMVRHGDSTVDVRAD